MAARDVILIAIVVFTLGCVFFATHFIGTRIVTVFNTNAQLNSSTKAIEAIGGITKVINKLDYVNMVIFIGMTMGMVIASYLVAGNAIFAFFYFIVLIVGVAFSTVLANFWETLSGSAVFGTTLSHFPITNNLLSNLPFYLAGIGFLGLVIMFAKPYITTGGEGY